MTKEHHSEQGFNEGYTKGWKAHGELMYIGSVDVKITHDQVLLIIVNNLLAKYNHMCLYNGKEEDKKTVIGALSLYLEASEVEKEVNKIHKKMRRQPPA